MSNGEILRFYLILTITIDAVRVLREILPNTVDNIKHATVIICDFNELRSNKTIHVLCHQINSFVNSTKNKNRSNFFLRISYRSLPNESNNVIIRTSFGNIYDYQSVSLRVISDTNSVVESQTLGQKISTRMNFAASILSFLIVTLTVSEAFKLNRCAILSHNVLASSAVSVPVTVRKVDPILGNFDYRTDKKLPWVQSGYKTWNFRGHNVNYIDVGNDDDKKKPPLLLIHGFGASIYHWRYNIPVLARDYHVYAIDLLGFGLSDKPIIDYSAELWRDQALAFIKEVVRCLCRFNPSLHIS